MIPAAGLSPWHQAAELWHPEAGLSHWPWALLPLASKAKQDILPLTQPMPAVLWLLQGLQGAPVEASS